MSSKFLLIFAVLLGVAFAELADFKKCDDFSDDVCEIDEVRIIPCKKSSLCKLRKGTRSSISFDFTPKFSSSKIKTGLFWASDGGDVAFPDLFEADGCQFTSCPLEAGKKQQLDYALQLSKKLPSGKYNFKWKLWNEENPSEGCCFKTMVELRK